MERPDLDDRVYHLTDKGEAYVLSIEPGGRGDLDRTVLLWVSGVSIPRSSLIDYMAREMNIPRVSISRSFDKMVKRGYLEPY